MTELVTESGLVLQGKTADAFIEERALELFRQLSETVNEPVSFATRNNNTIVGLGSGPTAQQLLNEQRGWPAIANRATMDRIAGFNWFAAERGFDDENKIVFTPLPDHIMNETLNRPNPVMSGRKLRMLISGLVNHTGAAYIQKLRDPLGVVRELWPIPTQVVQPVSAEGKIIGAYRITGLNGQQHFLPVEDVIRIWRPDLRTIWGQLGTLGPQALEYDAFKFMTEHLRSYFEHDGTPHVALMADEGAGIPTAPERTEFLSAWRRSHNRRVGSQVGLPAFIPQGFKIHEFSADAVDEGMAEFEDRWARQLMAGPGVPRFAVGIDTNTNRATAETTMWAWDRNSNKPLTDLIADDMTLQYAQPDFFETLAVRFEDFVQVDKEFQRAQEDQDLRTGVRSVNQVRESRDMDPVSWGANPIMPFSMQPYTGEELDDGLESVNDLRGEVLSSRHGDQRDATSFFSPESVWERNLRVERKSVGRFAAAQLRVWDVQRLEARRLLAATADIDESDLRVSIDGNAKARRAAKRREPKVARSHSRAITVDDVFRTGAWVELYQEEIGPIRADILGNAALETAEALAPEVETFVLSGFVETELAKQGASHVSNVDRTTRRRLAASLAEAATTGESISQIAKRLDDVFQDRKRSRTVARTEVGAANQAGTVEGMEISGVVKGKKWNDSRDGAVRDSHIETSIAVAPLKGNFLLPSGASGQHPLDRSFPADEIVNCRCFVTPVLIEEP